MADKSWKLVICLLILETKSELKGPNVCKQYKAAVNERNEQVYVVEQFCCAGYVQQDNQCIERDRQTDCPRGFCGEGCITECSSCPASTTCHPRLCCVCPEGLYGDQCNTACPRERFGQNCMQSCDCSGHGSCDVRSGECVCDSGWTGLACSTENVTKRTCEYPCDCLDPYCTLTDDQCICPTTYNRTHNNTQNNSNTEPDQPVEVFIHMVLFAGLGSTVCVVLMIITLVILLTKRSRTSFTPNETGDTEMTGHYDEINPYHEIQDHLVLNENPYYINPDELNNLRQTSSLQDIQIKDDENIPDPPKYLSLPNLTDYKSFCQYININSVHTQQSIRKIRTISKRFRTGSGYRNRYQSLQPSTLNRSGYLHPYTVLKRCTRNKQRHISRVKRQNADLRSHNSSDNVINEANATAVKVLQGVNSDTSSNDSSDTVLNAANATAVKILGGVNSDTSSSDSSFQNNATAVKVVDW